MPKKNSTNEPRPIELELAGIIAVLRQISETLKQLDKHVTELLPPPMPRQSGPIPGPNPFLASQWKRQDGTNYGPKK